MWMYEPPISEIFHWENGLINKLVLMSSYRDFITDQNWEYLRISHECTELYFERQSNSSEKSELIVLPGWPQIVLSNLKTLITTNRSSGKTKPFGRILRNWRSFHAASRYQRRIQIPRP